jgi:glyceraldehyde 3-phosphate dehydrogenase|tara:strand:- start:20 stop:1036 length:1017 start_codon:yes stop_codon:yes gene_type:complete
MNKIAINGFGRIGKLVTRRLFDKGFGEKILIINDYQASVEGIANLLEFDSIHGTWRQAINIDFGQVIINGHKIKISKSKSLSGIDLEASGIDFVIDCTGINTNFESLNEYKKFGIKKVLVSAPVNDDRCLNLVYGVNHHLYDESRHSIITAASCTTNCLAPIIKVLDETIGIEHGTITSIHNITNSQNILDKPSKNLRRSRSALNSLIPSTTGSASAISLIFPSLKGKLNGHAVRVPVMNASLTDCVFEMKRKVSAAQINKLFQLASEQKLTGILGYEHRQLVSADFVNNPLSAIIDGPSTLVINDTQLKVYAWYDNEWSYACRMVDLINLILRRNAK